MRRLLFGVVLGLASASASLHERASKLRDEELPEPDQAIIYEEKAARAVAIERSILLGDVHNVLDALDCAARQRDPFGFPVYGEGPFSEAVDVSSRELSRDNLFGQALRKLKFTAVSPRRGEVFLGSRKLAVGQNLVLQFRGQEFEALLVELSAALGVFENRETSFRLALPLGIVPGRKSLEGTLNAK